MDITQYKLIKIKYNHTPKEVDNIFLNISQNDANLLEKLEDNCLSYSTHKRNNIVDWFWLPIMSLETLLEVLEKYNVRYDIIDHTDTYFLTPNKITVLKNELDEWMEKNVTIDNILDRITQVGYDRISVFEKLFLEKNSKNI